MSRADAAIEEVRRRALAAAPELGDAPIVALGWATVDLDATLARLATGEDAQAWDAADRDTHLGARATVHRPTVASSEPIQVLLEPDTEGRLAASLARHGEGFAAIWFDASGGVPAALATRLGTPAEGPLGRTRLLLGGPKDGPLIQVLVGDDA